MAEDLMQMQRQAAQRVSRMQQHAQRVFEEYHNPDGVVDTPPRGTQAAGFTRSNIRSSGFSTHAPIPAPMPCKPHATPHHRDTKLVLDGDQWLLLGLALLLFRSGCRTELAIALLYLAL